MAQDRLLRFQRVFVLSGKTQILADVSFEIGTAERVALIGGPLSGKSLILQLAIGLARPSSGSIDGSAIQRSKCSGVIFDTVSLLEELTVRGNLRYFGMLYGMWGRALKRRIEEVAEGLGASDLLGARVTDLDIPQLCLADIARALIHHPRLLLIDEHRSGLEHHEDEALMARLLASPLAEGLAVLIARRQPPRTPSVSRQLFIEDGRIARDGLPQTVVSSEQNDEGTTRAAVA
jgi:ABC-type multidrug transport system ATPase subunit